MVRFESSCLQDEILRSSDAKRILGDRRIDDEPLSIPGSRQSPAL
jgi:hypothetical protein